MSENKTQVGFIGIGAMGTPMSQNILKAGFPLTVYDRMPARTSRLAAWGSCRRKLCGGRQKVGCGDHHDRAGGRGSSRRCWDRGRAGRARTRFNADRAPARWGSLPRNRWQRRHGRGGWRSWTRPCPGPSGRRWKVSLASWLGATATALDAKEPVLRAMGDRIFHVGPKRRGQCHEGDREPDDRYDSSDGGGDADPRAQGWSRPAPDARKSSG